MAVIAYLVKKPKMYGLLKNLLFCLPPETAHELVKSLQILTPNTILKRLSRIDDPALKTRIGTQDLASPIGLAAGFDKNGEMTKFLDALGFGFLELGSVTALPCPGNPKPRIFRLPKDQSLINRMGLPNWGAEKFAAHLQKHPAKTPVGINIAKTPDLEGVDKKKKPKTGIDDFAQTYRQTHALGCYTVFNLSCPNTADGKTFEDPVLFADFAKEMAGLRRELKDKKPVLVKLSPDTDTKSVAKIVDEALKQGFDGFVVSNTTSQRPGLKTPQALVKAIGRGGLSGQTLTRAANAQLKAVSEQAGKKAILIGVGGIMGFADLLDKLSCGARLVEIYTGFIYRGPFFVADLNRRLARFCKKRGVKDCRELVGVADLAASA